MKLKTENVIFVMTDGLRWQEVFTGADPALMNKENGAVSDIPALKQTYWRSTPEARREILLPFLWNTVARRGQIYGNYARGSQVKVTNGFNFSYPGYQETLCGFADPRINSNNPVPNPNETVFEWLHRKPKYRGSVAAFGAWDVFSAIFNARRCGFPVNAGFEPLTEMRSMTPRVELLNRLKAEMPRPWGGEPYDAITYYTALEYLTQKKPRLLFLSLGETDEWAHEGKYAQYLDSARRVDIYLKNLWETVQNMGQYRNKTTLIVAVDHGRGEAPQAWKGHGAQVKGSENIWMAFLGPDTPPLGERTGGAVVTQNQIAATLAAFLGEDYTAAMPKAGKPIDEVIGTR
ncbi:MAG: alkaline phosphatase family protein [Armatimonadota bacterium]